MSEIDSTTKTCKICGETFPATDEYFYKNSTYTCGLESKCKICARLNSKEYRQDNREKISQYQRQYREVNYDSIRQKERVYANANREKKNEQARAWKKANPEKVRANNKKWRENNPDKVRFMHKRYSITHRTRQLETNRKWRKSHPEYKRKLKQSRRAKKLGLLHTFTAKDWRKCLEYWRYHCAYCGRPRGLWRTLSQDHFIALNNGGGYTLDNIIPACHGIDGCNEKKQDRDPYEWLNATFGERKAKEITARIEAYFTHVVTASLNDE